MKRGAEREMSSPQKRPRSLGHEIRVLIPSRAAGSVIGKGGQNISRLRTENKANVSVPDCQGPERLITIGSDEQETTINVLGQVLQLIHDDQNRGNGGETGEAEVMEVRVLFHHSQVGSIIGKGGSKIKELRETTNAQIKVYGNVCPRSTDRVVAVSGPVDVCVETVRLLLSICNDSPLKGPIEKYDPHNYDEYHAMEYGGFGEPRGGGGDLFRGPPRRGPPPRYFPSNGNRGGRGGDGFGGPGREGGEGDSNGYGDGPPLGMRPFGDAGGPPMGGGDMSSSCQVTIPNDYAGAIIGKGGSRIRRIRQDSGAGITIAEPNQGSNERIITITGSQGQIRMAQYLLQQSVKEHHA